MHPAHVLGYAALVIEELHLSESELHVVARPRAHRARCPACGHWSRHVHSHYGRVVADLPSRGRPIILHLRVRRFRCRFAPCPQRTFAERVPGIAPAYARRTPALLAAQVHLSLAVGARPGARLAQHLGLPVSSRTLLRQVHALPVPEPPPPRVIGVDEWAWRRGQIYGSAIVDLERHRPVALLPDRSAASVVRWLRAHPSVEVAARDRSRLSADALTRGAPTAVQVADRWHLLHSLADVLEHLLERHATARLQAGEVAPLPSRSPYDPPRRRSGPRRAGHPSAAEREQAWRRARRLARYQDVRALADGGAGLLTIARQLGMSHHTVQHYLRAGHFPERELRGPGPSVLDPYKADLLARWQAGEHNGVRLYQAVRAHGFTGSRVTVSRFVTTLRHTAPERAAPQDPRPRPAPVPSARRVAALLLKRPTQRTTEEAAYVQQLRQADATLRSALALAARFIALVRERAGADLLDRWLAAATQAPVRELRGFAAGLRTDLAAVRAAVSLPWSNGQTEAQMTRLKVLKRAAYGRASRSCNSDGCASRGEPHRRVPRRHVSTQSGAEPVSLNSRLAEFLEHSRPTLAGLVEH